VCVCVCVFVGLAQEPGGARTTGEHAV